MVRTAIAHDLVSDSIIIITDMVAAVRQNSHFVHHILRTARHNSGEPPFLPISAAHTAFLGQQDASTSNKDLAIKGQTSNTSVKARDLSLFIASCVHGG